MRKIKLNLDNLEIARTAIKPEAGMIIEMNDQTGYRLIVEDDDCNFIAVHIGSCKESDSTKYDGHLTCVQRVNEGKARLLGKLEI